MHHSIKEKELVSKDTNKILLVGNPNTGKSLVFGHLTGRYVTVSNYPGTTVEISSGFLKHSHNKSLVIDTPGTNSLIPMSEDEKVTRDMLIEDKPQLVIQVADTKNLRRSLFLTLQLIEIGLPLVLNLNMMDEAKERGIEIKEKKLEEILQIGIVSTIATEGLGIDKLFKSLQKKTFSSYRVSYDENVDEALEKMERLLPGSHIYKKSLTLSYLSSDETTKEWLSDNLSLENFEQLEEMKEALQKKYSEPLSLVITKYRMREVEKVLKKVYSNGKAEKTSTAKVLGRYSMHPLWGIPILLLILFAIYQIVGKFAAGTLVNFFENTFFGKFINPFAGRLFSFIPVPFVQELFVGKFGIITMALTYAIAIILPIVGMFFFVFGILEDSGYLPRLAIMVNRLFKFMGLNGKAVLPMILGLGCDTMATLTSRILGSKKEKIIVTLLLALGVPCSAQLGVILGMLGRLSLTATLIWSGVVLLVIVLVGFLASLVIPGKSSDFILEIPPIRVPKISNLLLKTWARIEWYLKEAVPLFIIGTLVLFFFDKFKLLSFIEKVSSPVIVTILGLPKESAQAFIVGFLRRDYGAAGLSALFSAGRLDPIQALVSLVTITLFIPCLANLLIIIKERGWKTALGMSLFIFPFAFAVGGILNFILRVWRVSL